MGVRRLFCPKGCGRKVVPCDASFVGRLNRWQCRCCYGVWSSSEEVRTAIASVLSPFHVCARNQKSVSQQSRVSRSDLIRRTEKNKRGGQYGRKH